MPSEVSSAFVEVDAVNFFVCVRIISTSWRLNAQCELLPSTCLLVNGTGFDFFFSLRLISQSTTMAYIYYGAPVR